MTTRTERDTFGPIEVPADKLWGAQTQRSLLNFDISGERQPREIITALAQVKRASAVVNHALGLLGDEKTNAIVAAADEVRASQQLAAAFTVDRSGHRIAAPMISDGARFIAADGTPAPMDDAARGFLKKLVRWTEEGKNLPDVWVSAAGATYRPGADEFINATLPFYYAGSWQIPNLSEKIGDSFDWVATGSPCGAAGCTGIPGGAALVAIKYTKNPEDVARVLEFLSREDIVREFSERTLFLPAHKAVIEKGGLDFQTDDPNAKAALNVFVAESGKLMDEAARLPAWMPASDVYAAMVKRLGQAMAGEMPVDDAIARIDSDIAEATASAAQ